MLIFLFPLIPKNPFFEAKKLCKLEYLWCRELKDINEVPLFSINYGSHERWGELNMNLEVLKGFSEVYRTLNKNRAIDLILKVIMLIKLSSFLKLN